MNFLLSNDDGYDAIGLSVLKKVLLSYGNVYVSAPKCQMSGASVKITLDKEMDFIEVNDKEIKVDGTPADSMALGFAYFKDIKFDIAFSGINKGYNLAKDTLYSGTIGAAIMASLNGVKVVSLSSSYVIDEEDLYNKTKYIIEYLFNNKILDYAPFVNVNYPKTKDVLYKGVKLGKIYPIPKEEHFILNENGKYRTYYRDIFNDVPIDSDISVVNDGYFSITPFKPSLEDNETYNKLKEIIK